MLNETQLSVIKEKIKELFAHEYSGHDYFHTIRVYNMAVHIAKEEKADLTVVQLAALLHDADDYKVFGNEQGQCTNANEIMKSLNISESVANEVCTIIQSMSYHVKDSNNLTSIEAKVVQDADRLDAIGAIGIARAFAYGGNHDRMMHDPEVKAKINMTTEEYVANKGTTINHFYEKLLKLKDLMNTETAKQIARKRHLVMEEYLEEFYKEWEGER